MDLSTMRAEVQARGFGHIPPALIDRWINLTYHDINDRMPWPFLETTVSGNAPLAIADFGNALSVVDTTAETHLEWEDLRTILERDPTLATTGTPESWYMDGNDLKVWPLNTSDTISVRYVKVAADLTGEGAGATPLSPDRFHYLYVEGACARAYRRANEAEAAADCFNEVETGLQKMVNVLQVPNYDSLNQVAPAGYGSTDW